ncbi:MAG: peptidylprolyl isomerase, partial [Planctomycetota bacterium]
SAGFYLAQELAHRLWGEQEEMADKAEEGVVESRIQLLDEGISVLQEALKDHASHPMAPRMEQMLKTLQEEKDWLEKHGEEILTGKLPSPREVDAKPEKLEGVERTPDEEGQLPRVTIKTPRGKIVVDLYEDEAPNHVANFLSLVMEGFYDGLTFHRMEDWVTQGGCPDGTGGGGPGFRIKAEINEHQHDRGAFGMARSNDMDSAGSQFYFVKKPQHDIDKEYTIFGTVVSGMDVVDRLQKGDKIDGITIVRLRDKDYKPVVIRAE